MPACQVARTIRLESEENLSARKMCHGRHIFLGNSVLLDGKYCLHQDNMSGERRICLPGKCVPASFYWLLIATSPSTGLLPDTD